MDEQHNIDLFVSSAARDARAKDPAVLRFAAAVLYFKWLNDFDAVKRIGLFADQARRYGWSSFVRSKRGGQYFLDEIVPYLASRHAEVPFAAQYFSDLRLAPSIGEQVGPWFALLDSVVLTRMHATDVARLLSSLLAADSAHAPSFETAEHLRRLMVGLVEPAAAGRVLDLGCGSGALLGEVVAVRSTPPSQVIGIDINVERVQYARLRMALLGFPSAELLVGSIADQRILDRLETEPVDLVLADPPLGSPAPTRDVGRNTERGGRAEMTFGHVALDHLSETGTAVLIVPAMVLSSPAPSAIRFRQTLFRRCRLRRVVYLGTGGYAGTGMHTAILYVDGPSRRQNSVWFHRLGAVSGGADGFNIDNVLRNPDSVVAAIRRRETEGGADGSSFEVPLENLYAGDLSLAPERYAPKEPRPPADPQGAHDALRAQARFLADRVEHLLSSPPANPGASIVSFGDVAEPSDPVAVDSGGQWLLSASSIEPRTGRVLERRLVSDPEAPERRVAFTAGTILFHRLNPDAGKAIYAEEAGCHAGDFLALSPTFATPTDPRFLAAVLRSPAFRDYCRGRMTGSTHPRISMKDLLDFEFVLPPLETQRAVADAMTAVARTVAQARGLEVAALTYADALLSNVVELEE